MTRLLAVVLLLTLAAVAVPASGADGPAGFLPAHPKAGERITLTYDAAHPAAMLRKENAVSGELLVMANTQLPVLLTAPLQREGTRWSGSLTLPAGKPAELLILRFRSGDSVDNNGGKIWSSLVYGPDDKPVRGALLQQAYFLSSGGVLDFKRPKDPAAARAAAAEERKLYPDNTLAAAFQWNLMLRESPGGPTEEKVKQELETLTRAALDNDEALVALLPWYDRTGQKQRGEELKAAALQARPKGSLARSEALSRIYAEKNPQKKIQLAQAFQADFSPSAREKESLSAMTIDARMGLGEYDQAGREIDVMEGNTGNMYNSLAWTMMEKGGDPESAVQYARKGVEALRHPSAAARPPYLNDAQWEQQRQYGLSMALDTYGFGLLKQGKPAEALPLFEEAFTLSKQTQPDIGQRFIECALAAGKPEKGLPAAADLIRSGSAPDTIVALYRRAYVAKKGSPAGLDASLAELRTSGSDKTRDEMKRAMLNQPAIPFELKNLQGATVRLADLKGKVVVLDFWATWCGPCKYAFPFLQKVYDKYKGNDRVQILTMNSAERVKGKEREDLVKKFIADNGYTFPVLLDDGFIDKYGVEGIPTQFVIDPKGFIQFKNVGSEGEEMVPHLSAKIDFLLEQNTGTAAQEDHRTAENTASVPELTKFHTVIYEIWHGAWPKKDTRQLAALLPRVEEGVASVSRAQLPGILRERKGAWEDELKGLQTVLAEYKGAVEKKEDQPLLDAAEKLHMRYERMVRVIRPPLKELDAFHGDLYMLYHYYMPGDSVAKMKESAAALKEKMTLLEKAALPARLKDREEKFTVARKSLSEAVNAFSVAAAAGELQPMKAGVRKVHDRYQALEKILE